MTAKEEALRRIAEIAGEHELKASDVLAELSARDAASVPKLSALTRLLGCLGAIFMLAGLGVFIEMRWDSMNSIARIAITLVPGIAAFATAFLAAADERREKIAAPLFLLAALLQPTGILVAIEEFSSGGDERHAILLASGVLFVQQILAFVKLKRAVLLFMTLTFAICFCAVGMDLIGLDRDSIAFALGLSILSVSCSIDRTEHAVITSFWYFAGSAAMLAGLFSLIEGSVLEILFLGASCGLAFFSIRVKSRGALVVATVAILSYIGYYTAEHFSDVVGWPIALIAFGMLLLGLSTAALRINRKYISAG